MAYTAPPRRLFRSLGGFLVAVAAATPSVRAHSSSDRPVTEAIKPASDAADRERALHVLNRLGFGPRPGDVERVHDTGVDAWIARQFNPASINDTAAEAALKDLPTARAQFETAAGIRTTRRSNSFSKMQAAAGNAEDMKMRSGIDLNEAEQATA